MKEIWKTVEEYPKYVGVSYDKNSNNWISNIQINKQTYKKGGFKTEEDAYNYRLYLEKKFKS